MKELITAMAGIMILMVFVLQFANNQIICSRIVIADTIAENFEFTSEQGSKSEEKEKLRTELAQCFNCEISKVHIIDEEETVNISVPIQNAIVCGDFLGIGKDDNVLIYRKRVWKNQ